MKRNFALIAAGGVTMVLAIVSLITGLSAFAAPTAANPQPEALPQAQVNTILSAPQPANAADTNAAFEAALKERESALQAQVQQLQQAIADLDATSQQQLNAMQNQLVGVQNETSQAGANLESLQANAAALQQVIQVDGAAYEGEVNAMAAAETQMRQQIDALNSQLSAAYNEIAQRQAAAMAAAQAAYNSGGGGGGGGGGGHHEDDDDEHEEHEHEDEHEDDD